MFKCLGFMFKTKTKLYPATKILLEKIIEVAGCGVRTHAHFCTEDLKSSPLTTRANLLVLITWTFYIQCY